MNVWRLWNNTDRGKPKYSDKKSASLPRSLSEKWKRLAWNGTRSSEAGGRRLNHLSRCTSWIRPQSMTEVNKHLALCNSAYLGTGIMLFYFIFFFWHSYVRALQIYFQIITNKMQRFLFIYFYRCSTGFRRFLRPSSGAHNCTYSFRYSQPTLLLTATMDEMEQNSISSMTAAVLVDNTWSCMYSCVLLMMGEGTAWNM